MMISILILMVPKTAYSAYIPVFLNALGFDNAASMMQIGVAMEVLFVFFIPFFLTRFGFKVTLMLGMISWAIRSVLFSESALSGSYTMVIIGLVLQGVCWDFFFTVADIYADKKAGEKIKAQAQSLRFIASNGVGLFIRMRLHIQQPCYRHRFSRLISMGNLLALPCWYRRIRIYRLLVLL